MQNSLKVENKTTLLVVTALMMGVIMVLTMIIRVPSPTTKGYINLGDAAIFLSVIMLGWKYGAVAAGVGSAMADAISGYMYFAPWTLGIKALMAVVMGLFLAKAMSPEHEGRNRIMQIVGMALGGITMVTGYYFAEVVMYGNWGVPLIEIPLNTTQFAVGMVLAIALVNALAKTPVGAKFAYRVVPVGKARRSAA
ncbi:MAG: ECF transporter S component [Eubacteriaceae bacterium]|jgi:uncharacterized membrane protein|nr:ECF transporter S component [Eubacteriaceae bacterium]